MLEQLFHSEMRLVLQGSVTQPYWWVIHEPWTNSVSSCSGVPSQHVPNDQDPPWVNGQKVWKRRFSNCWLRDEGLLKQDWPTRTKRFLRKSEQDYSSDPKSAEQSVRVCTPLLGWRVEGCGDGQGLHDALPVPVRLGCSFSRLRAFSRPRWRKEAWPWETRTLSSEGYSSNRNRTPKLPSRTGEEVSLKSEDNGANNPNTEATKFTRIFRVLENLMTNHFSFSANTFKNHFTEI